MGKDMCVNGTLADSGKYSSPVPIIGLYIALGSVICCALILCDVWAGFRRRKLWFPCRFFSLNSVTLTLIAVAAKIPVDLTTEMPSAQDQLSKLVGMVFICMTMGFMIPSVGIGGESESYANVTALSIFVITVFVNICLQMATGVIYRFKVEHSIILFCMLLLLVKFWFSVVEVNLNKDDLADKNKELMEKGGRSMLERLESCYLYAYDCDPQFQLCKVSLSNYVPLVCSVCSLALMEAMLRSLVFQGLKFCEGVSDYKWSMWFMVITQVVTVVLISFAIGLRWLTYCSHFSYMWMDSDNRGVGETFGYFCGIILIYTARYYRRFLYLFASINLPKYLEVSFRFLMFFLLIIDHCWAILNFFLTYLMGSMKKNLIFCKRPELPDSRPMERFKELYIEDWVLKKGVEDMKRWITKSAENRPKLLMELLSSTSSSFEESHTSWLNAGDGLSSLSILVLVEIARVTAPTSLHAALTNSFSEVFEVICFINEVVNVGSVEDRMRSREAEIIWRFGSVHEEVSKIEIINAEYEQGMHWRPWEEVVLRLHSYRVPYGSQVWENETRKIIDVLESRSYGSSQEVYDHIRQLAVDMLRAFLAKIPDAIFKYVVGSPVEEYEDRVRFCLGLVCKFEWLETHYIVLSFPSGSDITRFAADTQTSGANPGVGNNNAATISNAIEDAGEIQAT